MRVDSMEQDAITVKGKARKAFAKLKERFMSLGFDVLKAERTKLALEKVESTSLKGKAHNFYRITFQPDQVTISYSSAGADRTKRKLEALSMLLNAITIAGTAYEVRLEWFQQALAPLITEMQAVAASESFATAQQFLELQEKHASLEKKYKDLVLSSETNTHILLECEKKRDEYSDRIKGLEGMSDEILRQEVFKWLKTHGGEIDISHFAKVFHVSSARAEEALDHLLKNGYLRKLA